MNRNIVQKNVSACPLNCWDACSFHVTVTNGKIIKVEGNKEHPVTDGKICGRGRMLAEKTADPNRITRPMKKTTKGKWESISWDKALMEISTKLREVKREYGPTSVLHSHDYSSNGLLKSVDERFFRAFGGWTKVEGSLCWGAGIEAQIRDFGNSAAHAPEDVLSSRHVVIWGRNVSRTNMHLFRYLKEARKKGISITVIDPMKNQTAKLADNYISIQPGSDGLLAAGVIKVILANHWEDSYFLDNHTYGFETLKKTLDSISLEEVVLKTGVTHKTLELLAEQYSNGPTSTFLGLGMQRYQNGGNTIRIIDALGAVSGNIGKAGGGVNYGHLPVGQSFDVDVLALREKEADIRTFTRMNQAEKTLEVADPPIKFIFVSRGNPVTQLPNSNLTIKAFNKAETVVVIDQYFTDTAELADYVLPSTTVFEEEDIYYASMYHSYVNYGPKLVNPPGEAKSDLWIWTELAKQLDFGRYFDYTIDEWLEMGTKSLREKGWSLEECKRKGYLKLPIEDIPWNNYQFQTPSGKYEFYSLKAKGEGDVPQIQLIPPLEGEERTPGIKGKFPYRLLSLHPLRSNHSQHYPIVAAGDTNVVDVSEEIASDLNLDDGDYVVVKNDRGQIKAVVRIEQGLQKDTINIDEGRWNRFGGSVNILTPSGESDMGKGSILYDCLVTIEKI
ncbi:anaerobic selenocysteine-containing dehydrogenase [Evansella vedderi]|uniref:Anaerobic selenocysteine-containing dehydrogenase n=1 Tax=Evansella vedderi TaxID=38282 RepID=A0ABU0A260_9BACI|nr:molybdopterin-dependent oxidoreductase [Evansella vedderi]MDQ0257578.1 anaerobic selenocysteine-containing dehydrogenase [Evansella vedderi]